MASDQVERQPLLTGGVVAPRRPEPFAFPPSLESGAQSRDAVPRAVWLVLWRRRWMVLSVAFMLATVAGIVSFTTKPVYRAVARVEVSAEFPQMESVQSIYTQLPSNDNFLRTQIQVLQTDTLAWRTIEQLDSRDAATFGKTSEVESQSRRLQLIHRFKDSLSVELVPGSRIIQVGFESTDPNLATRVVNTLVKNYIDYSFRQQYDATRETSARLEQQLDELKAKVEKSQQALVEYERANAIVSVNNKENVIEQRLGELSSDLTAAQNERIQKQALYEQVSTSPVQADALADNELIQKLKENYSALENQYVEAQEQYGPTFPKVTRLQKQMDAAQSLVDKERKRILDRIHGEYLAALEREKLISAAVAQQKDLEGRLNQLLVQHNLLKGEFDTNQQLYQRLLQELKDATVAAGLRSTNIHFVDPALPPTLPERPRKKQNVAIALVAGLVLGSLLAFVRESFDSSVRTPEDVELLIASPLLAMIPVQKLPVAAKTRLLRGGALGPKDASSKDTTQNVAQAALHQGGSALVEAYRALRTATLLSTSQCPPTSILVTSSRAGEGKTSTACNLAITLAQSGANVVILDCDMRKPGISRAMGVQGRVGMSNLLAGQEEWSKAILPVNDAPHLYVIPSGMIPPNPAELLASKGMEQLLAEISSHFRHIIIDSPPLLAVTDATIISNMVDGVILVVEAGATHNKMVVRAHRMIESAGGRVLGAVLNKYDVHSEGYYGAHYYTYPYSSSDDN